MKDIITFPQREMILFLTHKRDLSDGPPKKGLTAPQNLFSGEVSSEDEITPTIRTTATDPESSEDEIRPTYVERRTFSDLE